MKQFLDYSAYKESIRIDAYKIINHAINASLPDNAVLEALKKIKFNDGKIILVAIGKAAFQMAKKASELLREKITTGVVITKYNHSDGEIDNLKIFEAGHPVLDSSSFSSTLYALSLVKDLNKNDNVLFLISGGGSALFENSFISIEELQDITKQLLSSGANIVEMNTIRKRLSKVKAGRFAEACSPAKVFSIVLSDIIGDPLDMIASGPSYPDYSTKEEALSIVKKYNLNLSKKAMECLDIETPKVLDNVETYISGSVKNLCKAAEDECIELGYKTITLTSSLDCEAKEAGFFLSSIARHFNESKESLAFIAGGETIVHLLGNGKGGRNQELALASSIGIKNLQNVAIFSVGSDGTDGPTDAGGAYVDQDTFNNLKRIGIEVNDVLKNNDAYNALIKCDSLLFTGATGTNVNDISVLLIKR